MLLSSYLSKVLCAALYCASLGEAQNQCSLVCPEYPEYSAFSEHLAHLTACEKAELLPIMDSRYNLISHNDAMFDEDTFEGLTNEQALANLKIVQKMYRQELSLLEKEVQKTTEVMFADCTSETSKSILAKHISVLHHAIGLHRDQMAELEEKLGE